MGHLGADVVDVVGVDAADSCLQQQVTAGGVTGGVGVSVDVTVADVGRVGTALGQQVVVVGGADQAVAVVVVKQRVAQQGHVQVAVANGHALEVLRKGLLQKHLRQRGNVDA